MNLITMGHSFALGTTQIASYRPGKSGQATKCSGNRGDHQPLPFARVASDRPDYRRGQEARAGNKRAHQAYGPHPTLALAELFNIFVNGHAA
jgi:hypothetical protein